MPHADLPFDPIAPADADFLSSGDDAIRKLTRQIIEALADLVVDVTADPLVLKDHNLKSTEIPVALKLRSVLIQTVNISDVVLAGQIKGGPQTVTGAELGDPVFLSWADGRFVLSGAVTAADTVTISYGNFTSGSITLTGAQLTIVVVKNTIIPTP